MNISLGCCSTSGDIRGPSESALTAWAARRPCTVEHHLPGNLRAQDEADDLRRADQSHGCGQRRSSIASRVGAFACEADPSVDQQIARAQVIVKGLVEESGSCLTAEVGVGPLIAAKIIAEVKSMGSVNSKAGFAMLSGTAPLPASSGQVTRHRLNRGGNRRLNHAIHMVAVTRLRLDPESKSYFERKLAEGKSKREAMRSLKRQIANRLFKCLERDARRAGMVHPQSGS